MPLERAAAGTSLIDVLDRVLDKGIATDAYVRVSWVGVDLITVETRVVVLSCSRALSDELDTRTGYRKVVGQSASGRKHESVTESGGRR